MSTREFSFDLLDDTRRLSEGSSAWLREHVFKVAELLGLHGAVRVGVIDDGAMTAAHKEYLDAEGTTDVITFDLADHEGAAPRKPEKDGLGSYKDRGLYGIDTDILVCLDEGLRHSTAGGYPVERELLLYVVHGVLHCLGWDDHDEAEAASMHELEDAILRQIGVGPVFRRDT